MHSTLCFLPLFFSFPSTLIFTSYLQELTALDALKTDEDGKRAFSALTVSVSTGLDVLCVGLNP
jgi:hypothetical protein